MSTSRREGRQKMNGKLCVSGLVPVLIILLFSALIANGCQSANVVTEERPVSDFNCVSLSGGGEVVITQGDEESLTVEAEGSMMSYIKTEVQDGTLILGFTDEAQQKGFRVTKPIEFRLSMKEIIGLDVSGPGNIHVPSLHTDQSEFVVNMGGGISVDSLSAEELVVRLTGRARVDVAGQVVEQNIYLAGGQYRAGKLETQVATVEVRGIGNAIVWATDALDVQVSGGGNVEYYGNPHVIRKVSGRAKLCSLGVQ